MRSRIDHRLHACFWLEVVTPLHVGGPGSDSDVDLPLAVDGTGRLYVPGTSLAGVLREWTGEAWSHFASGWGFQQGDDGRASEITVHDSLLFASPPSSAADWSSSMVQYSSAGSPLAAVVFGVGLDRFTGTAAPRALYSRAVIPRGAAFRLDVRIDTTSAEVDGWNAWLGALAHAFVHSRIVFGADRNGGGGRVRAVKIPGDGNHYFAARRDSFTSRHATLEALRNIIANRPLVADGTLYDRTAAGLPASRQEVRVVVKWAPRTPVMNQAGEMGVMIDILPLTTRKAAGTTDVTPVMTGKSIKGVLRSHAERIVRTIQTPAEFRPVTNDSREFLKQIQVELVTLLFGVGAERSARSDDDSGNAGSICVLPCHANASIGRALWDRLLTGVDQNESTSGNERLDLAMVKELRERGIYPETRVAIDRWTGSAAEGMLFSIAEPVMAWEDITLTVNVERLKNLGGADADVACALLLLVLNDLRCGRLGLGFGVNRGLGWIDVESITLDGLDGASGQLDLASFANWPEPVRDRLVTAWSDWCRKQPVVS